VCKICSCNCSIFAGHETSGRYKCVVQNSSEHFTLYGKWTFSCWLSVVCLQCFDTVGWKSIRPVQNDWWSAGMVICLKLGANDWHMHRLISLPPCHFLLHYRPRYFIFLLPPLHEKNLLNRFLPKAPFGWKYSNNWPMWLCACKCARLRLICDYVHANMPAYNWYVITCMQMCPPTTTFQQSVESVEFVVSMSRLCTYVLHIITPTTLLSGCSWRDGDAAFCQVTVDTCWFVEWHSGRTSVYFPCPALDLQLKGDY